VTPSLRRAISVLGLAALVAGVPAVLVAVVGWPLPRGLPTPTQVAGALDDGWRPGGRFVVGVLALVGWALWAQLMRHVVAEVRRLRLAGDDLSPVPPGRGWPPAWPPGWWGAWCWPPRWPRRWPPPPPCPPC
jgi:hypothetical protein